MSSSNNTSNSAPTPLSSVNGKPEPPALLGLISKNWFKARGYWAEINQAGGLAKRNDKTIVIYINDKPVQTVSNFIPLTAALKTEYPGYEYRWHTLNATGDGSKLPANGTIKATTKDEQTGVESDFSNSHFIWAIPPGAAYFAIAFGVLSLLLAIVMSIVFVFAARNDQRMYKQQQAARRLEDAQRIATDELNAQRAAQFINLKEDWKAKNPSAASSANESPWMDLSAIPE